MYVCGVIRFYLNLTNYLTIIKPDYLRVSIVCHGGNLNDLNLLLPFCNQHPQFSFNESLMCFRIQFEAERLKDLEHQQDKLNSSLLALTTHFAQVQFRLKQIVDAPAEDKQTLLRDLEEFAFRGIPEIPEISSDRSSRQVSLQSTQLDRCFFQSM